MGRDYQNIDFLLTKKELQLVEEACLFGADADVNIENATKEKSKYKISFLHEELDDLLGFLVACANHEESEQKEKRWDKLENYLNISEKLASQNNLIEFPKQKQKCGLKYYIFDISVENTNILRRIQIAETKSLYNFARVIVDAFGFYFDHCFAFYDNFKRYHDSKKSYELFVDIGEEPLAKNTKGVKKTKIKQAFKKCGEKMLFLFDYGDCWRFEVKLIEIKNAEKWDLKPVTLKNIGKSPEQYPPMKEDGI